MNHILKCHDIVKTDFVRGENYYLYDSQGKRYIDLESGIWCTNLGNSHPRINQVMKAQIDKVIHLGTRYPNVLAEDSAMDILNIIGIDSGKCIFLSSGSEAVEFGVQIARRITKKQYLLTFLNSYLAAYGSSGRKSSDEWCLINWDLPGLSDPLGCLEGIPFEKIAAFVFEPGGSGSGFVKFPPKQLVQDIAQFVKQGGGLIVVNEITTGMGRTGRWFGFQHYGIQPDIVCLGKALGNVYPVSAVAMNQSIAEELEHSGFHYVQSHQNDPLGCAIAREVIAILRDENWIEKGNSTGTYFLEELKRVQQNFWMVKDAR